MLIRIGSAKCLGIQAVPITVEVNISSGIGIHLVGLGDVAVKESLLRTITALQSMQMHIPGKKIVINLAPADMHKRGSGYDVPIALGIIAASGQMPMVNLENFVILGELGLDGTVRAIQGALPIVEMARDLGRAACILPEESAMEALELDGIPIYGVRTLTDVLRIVNTMSTTEKIGCNELLVDRNTLPEPKPITIPSGDEAMDFAEIMGQEAAKRGLEIAAAGGHNVIFIGPAGAGKTSLAHAVCTILPPMTNTEALETSKIYSVSGQFRRNAGLMRRRPFRAPHISASVAAMIGGGADNPLPGEVSLAHNGILFLDEFCEAPRRIMEVLRGPLEDRRVILSRLKTKVEYPASFTLIAATNPCPCGFWGDGDRCTCSVSQRNSYLNKLSGPLMDRIDLQLWVSPLNASQILHNRPAESSATIAHRVRLAREIQKMRFKGEDIYCNAQMNNRQIKKFCTLDKDGEMLLEKAIDNKGMSVRACSKIIKIARTIADLENIERNAGPTIPETSHIESRHIAEALSYRLLDRQIR